VLALMPADLSCPCMVCAHYDALKINLEPVFTTLRNSMQVERQIKTVRDVGRRLTGTCGACSSSGESVGESLAHSGRGMEVVSTAKGRVIYFSIGDEEGAM
jgi:hypothetical protein